MTAIKYKGDAMPKRAREVPPYNGFGSEEDSLCSCMALLPKPPKRDFIKFMEKVCTSLVEITSFTTYRGVAVT